MPSGGGGETTGGRGERTVVATTTFARPLDLSTLDLDLDERDGAVSPRITRRA